MKNIFFIITFMIMPQLDFAQATKSFHDFTMKTIEGNDVSLYKFKGKKLLVVNVASKCGLTPQYKKLQELHTKYGGEKFQVLGFPANNFGSQEPGSNDEIKAFCTKNFGVTFPMFAKISVKGDDIHPLYEWLTQKELNGTENAKVKWNFQKFMIDEEGKLVDFCWPQTSPNDDKIVKWITGNKD
ncbi:glutathione peroxidase [Bacteroidales bacterium AH-315-N07]|nr:glutathione peroxidase [Bacteroidales bacterium AH-315-N07]